MGLACARACGCVRAGPSLPLRPQHRVLFSQLHRRASGSGHSLLEDPSPGPGSPRRLHSLAESVAPAWPPRPPLVLQALGDCPVTPYFTDDETGLSTTFTTPALRAPAQRGSGRGPHECLGPRAGSSRAGILAPASLGHGPVPSPLWASVSSSVRSGYGGPASQSPGKRAEAKCRGWAQSRCALWAAPCLPLSRLQCPSSSSTLPGT